MRQFVLSLAGLAIATAFSLAPVPALAGCGIHQGGECGRDAIFRPGEPRWGSRPDTYVDRNQYGHGNAGHWRSGGRQSVVVVEPFIYLESRTCVRWVQPGGVGPKRVIGTYAC